MTDNEAKRFYVFLLVLAAVAFVLLIVGCTIIIGDSNKVEQEINTDSRLRARASVDDVNNKEVTKGVSK